jgi:hypothetical protein
MVGLVDIALAVERVTIRGQEVEVFGVSAAGLAQLLARFPDLRKLFSGRDLGAEELIAVGGDLVAAIIAAGTGDPGDPVVEEAAGRLGIDEQADMLSAILRVTLPKGLALSWRSCWRSGPRSGTHPGQAAPSRSRPRHHGIRRAADRLGAPARRRLDLHAPAAGRLSRTRQHACSAGRGAGALDPARGHAHETARSQEGDQVSLRVKRLKVKVDREPWAFLRAFMAAEEPIARAGTAAVGEAGDRIKVAARADIAAAGFSRKWQNALRVTATRAGARSRSTLPRTSITGSTTPGCTRKLQRSMGSRSSDCRSATRRRKSGASA